MDDPRDARDETGKPRAEPFAVPPTYAARKTAETLEIDLGDGIILYNGDASLVHHLNPPAAIVWALCDGAATIAEIAADIAAEYGHDPETVQHQVATLIAEFDALGLVEDAAAERRSIAPASEGSPSTET